jgi:hypothetical protein
LRILNPLQVDPLDLFKDSALTIAGGATPSRTSDPTNVSLLSKLYVFVTNAGLSTSVTVTIKGKLSATSLMYSDIAVFTLGAGTAQAPYGAGRYIELFPSMVYAVITNNDATPGNTASVTVTLNRFR